MKFLLLLAVLTIAFYVWRSGRRGNPPEQPPGPSARDPGAPQDMVQCARCQVHLPRPDALAGPGGALYCSEDHRLRGPR